MKQCSSNWKKVHYNNRTISFLTEETGFDWLKNYFKPLQSQLSLPDDMFNETTNVVVRNVHLINGMVQLLNATSTRTLSNYINWMLVMKYSTFATKQMRRDRFELMRTMLELSNMTTRSEMCFNMIDSNLKFALSWLYSKDKDLDSKINSVIHN